MKSALSERVLPLESFEKVLEQYEPMIYSIMRTLNIFKDQNEYYQIGLIALWKASHYYDPSRGGFTNYAYISIRGCMLNELNTKNRYEKRHVLPEEDFWKDIDDPKTELNLQDSFDSILSRLTENQRKWLLYVYHFDLSVTEIAKRENVSVSAVKAWRAGARDKLRKLLPRT